MSCLRSLRNPKTKDFSDHMVYHMERPRTMFGAFCFSADLMTVLISSRHSRGSRGLPSPSFSPGIDNVRVRCIRSCRRNPLRRGGAGRLLFQSDTPDRKTRNRPGDNSPTFGPSGFLHADCYHCSPLLVLA